jgi:hypothetical protein
MRLLVGLREYRNRRQRNIAVLRALAGGTCCAWHTHADFPDRELQSKELENGLEEAHG